MWPNFRSVLLKNTIDNNTVPFRFPFFLLTNSDIHFQLVVLCPKQVFQYFLTVQRGSIVCRLHFLKQILSKQEKQNRVKSNMMVIFPFKINSPPLLHGMFSSLIPCLQNDTSLRQLCQKDLPASVERALAESFFRP